MTRVGVKVPNEGEAPGRLGLGRMALLAERAGFDSVWTTDHVVQPLVVSSPYPFTADGRPEWSPTTPWYDAVVTLAVMAEATEKVELGLAVLVCGLRDPVVAAKQLATVDALAGGRVICGVGAGWMAEEYAALGIGFDDRGSRLEEWVKVARSVWTGDPGLFEGAFYRLPVRVATQPVPAREMPVLVGGNSPLARRRAGRLGGWVGHTTIASLDLGALEDSVNSVIGSAERCGAAPPRIATRLAGTQDRHAEVVKLLPVLSRLGVDDVIIDVDWSAPDDVAVAGSTYFG